MIKLKDKETKQTYYLPTKIEELTFSDFMALHEWNDQGGDSFDMIAKLAGMPRAVAIELAQYWEGYDGEKLLSYLYSLIETKPPKRIRISGVAEQIKIKSFDSMTTAQRIAISDKLKTVNKAYEALPYILAVGLAPQVYGDSWLDDLDLMQEDCKGLEANVAVPIAYFFLSSSMILSSDGLRSSFQKIVHLLKRGARKWLNLGYGTW